MAPVAGGIAWLAGRGALADACWAGGTVIAVVTAVAWVVGALRRGRVGVGQWHRVVPVCGEQHGARRPRVREAPRLGVVHRGRGGGVGHQ
ncbi:metal cation transporter p-type ATPase [Streptomyces sp. 769]|nr:metal cation transporter p-type ATPase [Streptomyces sp. 769]